MFFRRGFSGSIQYYELDAGLYMMSRNRQLLSLRKLITNPASSASRSA